MNDGIYTIPPCGTENLVAVCKELRSFGSLIELFFFERGFNYGLRANNDNYHWTLLVADKP
jgi:hypothetical protein